MITFVEGRFYRGDEVYRVNKRTKKTVRLSWNTGEKTCRLDIVDGVEQCCPKNFILKASSIMGRPKVLTDEQAKKHRTLSKRKYNEKTFKTVTFALPPEVAKNLKEYAEDNKTSQREIVIFAVNEFLNNSPKKPTS